MTVVKAVDGPWVWGKVFESMATANATSPLNSVANLQGVADAALRWRAGNPEAGAPAQQPTPAAAAAAAATAAVMAPPTTAVAEGGGALAGSASIPVPASAASAASAGASNGAGAADMARFGLDQASSLPSSIKVELMASVAAQFQDQPVEESLAKRRRTKQAVPEELKDEKYFRRRQSNNEAVKRLRERKNQEKLQQQQQAVDTVDTGPSNQQKPKDQKRPDLRGPARHPLDDKLLGLFAEDQLRLPSDKWQQMLHLAHLNADELVRVKQLRRRSLCRVYSGDTRKRTMKRQSMQGGSVSMQGGHSPSFSGSVPMQGRASMSMPGTAAAVLRLALAARTIAVGSAFVRVGDQDRGTDTDL